MVRRKVTFRPSKARLVLWAVSAVVAGWLAFELMERAPEKLAGQDRMHAAAAEAAVEPGGPVVDTTPPAARIGLMPRAAHLVVLSGLEMGLYDVAARTDGRLEVRVYDRSRGIAAALREGELDVASVPLRVAVELRAELGERAPIVVAGAALGDERYVVRDGLAAFETLPFGPLRIGVLEAPALDLARALGVGGDDPPTVRLVTESAVTRMLASGELDLALLPQPLASQVAALSSSAIEDGRAAPARRIVGGAVLVASPAFAAANRPLLERLVGMHAVSARFVANDPETAVGRATTLLEGVGAEVPPAIFWARGIERLAFDDALPRDALAELAELGGIGPVEALLDDSYLAEAHAAEASATLDPEGDDG